DLFASGIISRDQSEQLRANADAVAQAVKADQAAIESAKAAIGAGQAAVEQVKVQLGYTTIKSAITGRTGNLTVKQGNVVTANNRKSTRLNSSHLVISYAVFCSKKKSSRFEQRSACKHR